MPTKKRSTPAFAALLTVILAALLAGCAVYPVVQVAGGAMTGYDAAVLADDYLPRDNVEGGSLCVVRDSQLERRLRERLQQNGIVLSAHVIDAHAYLVGQVLSRAQADQAVQTASTVEGVKTITCKFYPASSPRDAARDAARDELLTEQLTERLAATEWMNSCDLRIEVIRANAILIGRARDFKQKTGAVAIASEVGGIREVTDYIRVVDESDQARVASK